MPSDVGTHRLFFYGEQGRDCGGVCGLSTQRIEQVAAPCGAIARLPRARRHKGAENCLQVLASLDNPSTSTLEKPCGAAGAIQARRKGGPRCVTEGSPIMSSTDVQAAPAAAAPGLFARLTGSAPAAATGSQSLRLRRGHAGSARGKRALHPRHPLCAARPPHVARPPGPAARRRRRAASSATSITGAASSTTRS